VPAGAARPTITAPDGIALAVGLCSAAAWAALFVARLNGLVVAAALGVLSAAAVLERRRELATLPVITALFAVLTSVPVLMQLWPAPLLLAVCAGLLLDRSRASWLGRGELGGHVAAWILVVVAVSAGALVAWWYIARPDVSDLPRLPAGLHPALLVGAVVAWAACNAAAEELYFRGALQYELVRGLGSAGVVVQALAFGAMHLHGFPRGWFGVGLAAVYGLMTGALRQRARGLLAPWIAHVAADLTIVAIRVVALG